MLKLQHFLRIKQVINNLTFALITILVRKRLPFEYLSTHLIILIFLVASNFILALAYLVRLDDKTDPRLKFIRDEETIKFNVAHRN